MSESAPAPTNVQAPNAAPAKASTPVEQHEKAARCHEMAAALHHEAARFYADGDEENALECAKQALTHGTRADALAAQLVIPSVPATTH